jgi:hypothetical protein
MKQDRIGQLKLNNQGCLMKIVDYIDSHNIVVEFQDEYKARVSTQYTHYLNGNVKNPYYPSIHGVGMIGNKYPIYVQKIGVKEYVTWQSMIQRCYDEKYKNKKLTYKDVVCCKEWLVYDNFYEWLHEQPNFDKWLNGDYAIDKDILVKGNKIYSPETCCLVPRLVNQMFTKCNARRGSLPIGVFKVKEGTYKVWCQNPLSNTKDYLGSYNSADDGFYFGYKPYKENLIKQVAKIEYSNGNITKRCYDAMMSYIVEIND